MENRAPDIVIVPTYTRPELLWCCLERIAKCDEKLDVRVYADQHVSHPAPVAEIEEVIARFPRLGIRLTVRPEHPYPGNSYNVLDAYKEAFASEAEFVFLVEDDVLIAPEFFSWHRNVQREISCFCTVGSKNIREQSRVGLRAGGYYTTTNDYASIGVCFRRKRLAPVIKHANDAYYRDLQGYIQRYLERPEFSAEYFEQDGLINRVMRLEGGVSAWPYRPVCQHIGWWGYNRPRADKPHGSLVERYAEVRRILETPGQLVAQVREFFDIEPLTV